MQMPTCSHIPDRTGKIAFPDHLPSRRVSCSGCGSAAYYLILVKAPHDLANNIAGGIRDAFNITPRVTIQQTVVIEQTTPILEVATVSRNLFVDHSWSHTWLGSTKTISLQASYTAKAGFDLREPFFVTIERNPLRVFTQLPPSRLLSLESTRIVSCATKMDGGTGSPTPTESR